MEVVLVQGLGWGDEGKGTVVDFACRQTNANYVVRFNGGSQAGHTVETSDGTRHVFNQFGSGTFAGAATYLSRYMIINPTSMQLEARALLKKGVSSPMDLIQVSPDALITTPYHSAANKVRESLRDKDRHGSCGMGIGETVSMSLYQPEISIRVKDLCVRSLTAEKMAGIRQHYKDEFGADWTSGVLFDESTMEQIVSDYHSWTKKVDIVPDEDAIGSMLSEGNLVFEGAQGVLLDETYGFAPHNTWSNTTFSNAWALLSGVWQQHSVREIGVLRSYSTRHGAGPLVTETSELDNLPEDKTNVANPWQGEFRKGFFDLVLAKYAIQACEGVGELALSCMDHIDYMSSYRVCTNYKLGGKLTDSMLKWNEPVLQEVNRDHVASYLSEQLQIPIKITSYGPTAGDKRWKK